MGKSEDVWKNLFYDQRVKLSLKISHYYDFEDCLKSNGNSPVLSRSARAPTSMVYQLNESKLTGNGNKIKIICSWNTCCISFLLKKRLNSVAVFAKSRCRIDLNNVYGRIAMQYCTIARWVSLFKEGRNGKMFVGENYVRQVIARRELCIFFSLTQIKLWRKSLSMNTIVLLVILQKQMSSLTTVQQQGQGRAASSCFVTTPRPIIQP